MRYKFHNSLSFTRPFGLGTVWAFRYSRYQGCRTMFVFSVGRLLSRRCHNISSIPRAFCNLLCPLLTSVTRWAHLTVRSVPSGTRNGSPGVIPATFDARLSDLPNTALRRIEDFIVCCRLVPSASSLYPLAVRQPASLPEASYQDGVTASPVPSASLRLRRGWHGTLD